MESVTLDSGIVNIVDMFREQNPTLVHCLYNEEICFFVTLPKKKENYFNMQVVYITGGYHMS